MVPATSASVAVATDPDDAPVVFRGSSESSTDLLFRRLLRDDDEMLGRTRSGFSGDSILPESLRAIDLDDDRTDEVEVDGAGGNVSKIGLVNRLFVVICSSPARVMRPLVGSITSTVLLEVRGVVEDDIAIQMQYAGRRLGKCIRVSRRLMCDIGFSMCYFGSKTAIVSQMTPSY